jgi:O-antigen/teichoic acid export membrane protein
LLRNNAIYLTGSVGVGLVGYAFHFVTGRLLGPAPYAIVAAMVSALSLLTLPSIVLQTVTARYASLLLAGGDLGALRRLVIQLSLVCLVGVAIFAGVLVILAPEAAGYLHVADTRVVYFLAIASAGAVLVAITRGALQGLSRFLLLSLNTLLDMATRLVVAVGLIVAGLGALGAAIGIAAGPLLAYAQSTVLLRRFTRSKPQGALPLADVGRYSLSAIAAAIGITYLLNIDVLLSKHFLSGHDSGLYAAGAVLGRVIYFLGMTVAAVMFPEVTLRHARGEAHFQVVEKSLGLLAILSGGLIAAYVVVPGLVIAPFGLAFAGMGPYLGLFAVAFSLFAFSLLFVNYFLSINSRRFIAPLLGACILETVLIANVHGDPGQVIAMVLISMAALAGLLSTLYLVDRLGIWRAPANVN